MFVRIVDKNLTMNHHIKHKKQTHRVMNFNINVSSFPFSMFFFLYFYMNTVNCELFLLFLLYFPGLPDSASVSYKVYIIFVSLKYWTITSKFEGLYNAGVI
jgi:hypothetical protein